MPVALILPAAPALAQASVSANCVAVVANNTVPASSSEQNPLFGGVYANLSQVTGPHTKVVTAPGFTGPTGAGQQCRQAAIDAFRNNAGWSDPAQYCARHADGKTHRVGIFEVFTDPQWGGPFIGHKGGYSLVAGYTVTCAGPTNVSNLTVPVVVPAPF